MTDQFKSILDALVAEGFQKLTEKSESRGRELDYRLTAYSLNTKLSFRFDSLSHFLEFLKLSDPESAAKEAVLLTTFTELGLDPDDFFWVNFFEVGKAEEM